MLHFRKALEIEPDNLRVRLALGEVLQQSKRPEEALAEAEAVLQADASNRFALDLKGRCLRDLKRYDEADAVADALLAGDPNDLKAAYLKVTIAESRRDFAGAAALIEQVLGRARPGDEDAASNQRVFLLHLGFAYQQLERYADAAAAFGRAKVAGDPPDAGVLNFHAEALYLAKQKDEALAAVRAARERFPEDVDLTGARGDAAARAGRDGRGDRRSSRRCASARRRTRRCSARVADFYRRAKQFGRGRGGAAPGADRRTRRACRAVPARRGARAAEAARRGGGGVPRGARRSSPTRRRCSTTSAT